MDVETDPPLKVNGTLNGIIHVPSETTTLTTSGPNNTLLKLNHIGNGCAHSKNDAEYSDLYTKQNDTIVENQGLMTEHDNTVSEHDDVAAEHGDVTANNHYVTVQHDGVSAEHETLLNAGENREDIELGMNTPEDDLELVPDEDSAPDGGWGWFIVFGCLLLKAILGGIGRSGGLFYMEFLERFHGSSTSTALITSLTGFVKLAAGPFVSILCSRLTGRSLTAVGAGLMFLGLIMSAYTPSQGFLYFSYGVMIGLGRAFALTPCPIMVGQYFDKRRSLAFGLASAGCSIGGFTITPVVQLLFQWFGFRGAFLILSGFVLNVFVCSALFRPIELHRKLTAYTHRKKHPRSEQGETVEELVHRRSSVIISAADSKDQTNIGNGSVHSALVNNDYQVQNGNIARQSSCDSISRREHIAPSCNKTVLPEQVSEEDANNKNKKKKRVLSLSILKDVRFLCFLVATFCFTLPTTLTFLPPLAASRGITLLQAATLLSINAGSDTVFRVISGFVLDLQCFRFRRIQIYNIVTFVQGIIPALFPLMTSYPEFIALAALDGMIGAIKNAQGSVVMLDMLGVDKFASSMAYTMAVQGLAVFVGPTVSGYLKDTYGTYDGSFYFGSAAILSGGLVMAVGNIRKHIIDKQTAKEKESVIEN